MPIFSKVARVTPLTGFTLAICILSLVSCTKYNSRSPSIIQPRTHVIKIEKFRFIPEILEINEGDLVRWENKDIVPHLIAEKTLKKWRSKDLLPNAIFTLKINQATSYICKLHPGMKAEIIVP
jgi:plastocyanin